ncbi:PHD finger protein ING1, partial [Glycine soja]
FSADLDSLPVILRKKYTLLRDLDKSLQDIKRQNEQRCEQEIEDIKRGVRSGNITPDTSAIRFSDEALDEQKHSIRVADEKVALAVQAYDLVDTNIQQLDQYLKKFDEEIRRERENAAITGVPASGPEGNTKSGRGNESGTGRGGRKKFIPNKRNRFEHKRLHDLVFVKYNQQLKQRYNARDEIDPISLNDIDVCNEWLVGEMDQDDDNDAGNDLVFEDDDALNWATVYQASGVGECRMYTRRKKQKTRSVTATQTSKKQTMVVGSSSRKQKTV